MSEQAGQGAADPFAESPGFFFTGAQRQHQLDTLGHLVAFGDMVLLVTGETGAGKSRLLAELARNAAHRLAVHRLRAESLSEASAVPGILSRLSGQALVGMAPEQAARAFFQWSASQAERDRRWVLVVDDADALGDEALEALVDGFAASDTGQAAVLVLAGTPELARRRPLADPARSAIVHEAALPPLQEEDVRHFIHASFDHVGEDATPMLTESAIRRIQQQSGGNLRAIRQVAPGILAGSPAQARPHHDSGAQRASAAGARRLPWRLWTGLALLALGISVITVSLQYGGEGNGSGGGGDGEVITEPSSEAALDEVEKVREVITETEQTEEGPGVKEGRIERARAEPLLDVSPLPVPVSDAPLPEDSGSGPEPEVDTDSSETGAGAETGDAGEQEVKGFRPRSPGRFRKASWYREQAQGAYTLQLLGSFNESTALEFMDEYEVEDAVYTRTRHKGKPWFIVVHGTYPSRDAARAAIESLPEPVKALNPWPRDYDDL
ncbi:AAA family ATPase [Halomonadaceae bacterium KBTZ08]